MIDAAEFVGPYLDRQLGLQKVAKYYYTPGWHEMATGSEVIINKEAWASLPPDLKAIVENACMACNTRGEAWLQKVNADAMDDLIKNQGVHVLPLPDSVTRGVARGNIEDPRRSGRQGSDHQKGGQFLHEIHDELPAVGEIQREALLRQRSSAPDVNDAGKLADGIDWFIDLVGRIISWLALAVALVMGTNVLLRYGFGIGEIWAQEMEWHLLVPLTLVGISYALRHGEHVRVDVLFTTFSDRTKPRSTSFRR